jgi:iron-sulfur cluster insertion protein
MSAITMTDGLVRRIRQMQDEKSDPGLMLRVTVNGGGCQGFEYAFGFAHEQAKDDALFEKDGVKLLIDETSLALLEGSEIDFVDELAGASFKIRNPNAQSTCGCGTSFSV